MFPFCCYIFFSAVFTILRWLDMNNFNFWPIDFVVVFWYVTVGHLKLGFAVDQRDLLTVYGKFHNSQILSDLEEHRCTIHCQTVSNIRYF